ncbi:MAG TPA: hypothetical protein VFN70_09745 [Burkholderiales bacterium]|nr:hypothetical protein [Burkholderiales bacterium]
MIAIDDNRLHEWAEFNLPAELLERSLVLSPLARRVLAAPPGHGEREAATGDAPRRAFPDLGSLLLPGLGFTTLPKP